MVMKVLREGAFGGFLKYVIMSLLALSVLGLVFMDVQGVLRGSVGGTDVAVVGDQTIGFKEFDTYVRLSLERYNMSPQKAYATTSLFDDFLGTLIRTRFVQQETENLGLRVSKKKIQRELIARIKPSQQDGENFQQTFERILREQGLREEEFLDSYNREIVGDIMMETVQSGFESVPEVSRDLFLIQNHTRDISLIVFEDKDIEGIDNPDSKVIEKLYNSYKQSQFKIPELRKFDIAYIDEEKLKSTLEISDSDLSEYYKNNIEDFKVPEQKVMEQVIVKEQKEAELIKNLVTDKKMTLEQAKTKIMGEQGMYVPSAPFREDMLIADIHDPVMQAKDGDVIGPLQTLMGFHVMHISETLDAHTLPLEEVRPSIKEALLNEKAIDRVYSLSDEMSDLLAGGDVFEDIQKTLPLKISSLPLMTSTGLNSEQKDVFEGLPESDKKDKDIILEEGFLLQTTETSRVFEFPSGRFGAVKLVESYPETFKPIDIVKDQIVNGYIKDQQRAENSKLLSLVHKGLENGSETFEAAAKKNNKSVVSHKSLSLFAPLPSPFSDSNRPALFEANIGQYVSFKVENGMAIARIDAYHLPDILESSEKQLSSIQNAVSKELRDEIFSYYLYNLGEKYPIHRNELLLRTAYGPVSAEGEQNR